MNKEMKKMLLIGAVVIVLIGGGFWAYSASQKPVSGPKADPKLLFNDKSHSTETGTRTYPITMVEFGDYQCPACAYAEPIVEKVLANDPEVKVIFRNFPLPQHQNALIAAEAAEAAGAQGKFWEMHNALYLNQDLWVPMQNPMDAFVEVAKKLNLDVEKFKQDVTGNKYEDIINKDRQDGIALGVQGTPTFFINGQQYLGGLSYETLQLALSEALKSTLTQQIANP